MAIPWQDYEKYLGQGHIHCEKDETERSYEGLEPYSLPSIPNQ